MEAKAMSVKVVPAGHDVYLQQFNLSEIPALLAKEGVQMMVLHTANGPAVLITDPGVVADVMAEVERAPIVREVANV